MTSPRKPAKPKAPTVEEAARHDAAVVRAKAAKALLWDAEAAVSRAQDALGRVVGMTPQTEKLHALEEQLAVLRHAIDTQVRELGAEMRLDEAAPRAPFDLSEQDWRTLARRNVP